MLIKIKYSHTHTKLVRSQFGRFVNVKDIEFSLMILQSSTKNVIEKSHWFLISGLHISDSHTLGTLFTENHVTLTSRKPLNFTLSIEGYGLNSDNHVWVHLLNNTFILLVRQVSIFRKLRLNLSLTLVRMVWWSLVLIRGV